MKCTVKTGLGALLVLCMMISLFSGVGALAAKEEGVDWTQLAASAYTITLQDTTNGTVTASKTNAIPAGTTITLTTYADMGYEVGSVSVMAGTVEVPTTAQGNGVYTFTMPSINATVTVLFRSTNVTQPSILPFADVPTFAWYPDYVERVHTKGDLNVTSDPLLDPRPSLTRSIL